MQQPNKNKSKIKPATRGDSLVVYNNKDVINFSKYDKIAVKPVVLEKRDKSKKPIIVSDKNDPRYRAYQDSLSLYEGTKSVNDFIKKNNIGTFKKDNDKPLSKDEKKYIKIKKTTYDKNNVPLDILKKQGNNSINPNIKPISYDKYVATIPKEFGFFGAPSDELIYENTVLANYKKPIQPVEVQDVRKTNTTTGKQVKEENDKGMVFNETLIKPRKKLIPFQHNLTPGSLIQPNMQLEVESNLIPVAQTPKSYKVETSGGGKFGGWKNISVITNPSQLSEEVGSKRTITPIYQEGGKINNNNMNYSRVPSRKRHINPAIIGAGINVASGLIQGAMQQNVPIKARSNALNQMWKEKSVSDTQLFKDYTKNIDDVIDYYANGGKLPTLSSMGKYNTTGGNLKPIADGVVEVQGNKHGEKTIDNSYGVTLHKGNQPIAEVEDKEIMVEQPDGDMVFSARLKDEKGVSFANRMKQLAKKRNKLEKDLDKNYDTKSRNSIERKLAGLNMAEEVLKIKQEEVKFREGQAELNKLSNGGKIPKYANGTMNLGEVDTYLSKNNKQMWKDMLPTLADNATNMLLTATTPKLPKPIRRTAANLETNYNVNPQLSEVKNELNSITDNIYKNTSNSNIARANIASTRLRGLQQINNILGQKQNIENQLKNQNKLNKQDINNSNIDADNQTNMLEFTRANDIQSRISGNLADMSSDIKEAQTRRDYNAYYDESMLLELLDDPTGVKARNIMNNPYLKTKYGKYFAKPNSTFNTRRRRIDANFTNNNDTVIGTSYLPRRIDANFNNK